MLFSCTRWPWSTLLSSRIPDIDDVILNTVGVAAGYAVSWVLRQAFRKARAHVFNRE